MSISDDKTSKVWSISDGKLLKEIQLNSSGMKVHQIIIWCTFIQKGFFCYIRTVLAVCLVGTDGFTIFEDCGQFWDGRLGGVLGPDLGRVVSHGTSHYKLVHSDSRPYTRIRNNHELSLNFKTEVDYLSY